MNPNGPYVSVAAICDAVLHEKDERISCIRFLDQLNITIASEDEDASIAIRLNAFIAFKSGPFIGPKMCTIEIVGPSGKKGTPIGGKPKEFPMQFNGGEHGHNLIVAFDFPVNKSGLYWFDVLLDGEVYTRIPLKINITRELPQTLPPENPQPQSE
jgi:hypothetical protein